MDFSPTDFAAFFKSKLSETDKKILEMRVGGYGLEEIAKATGYKTARYKTARLKTTGHTTTG